MVVAGSLAHKAEVAAALQRCLAGLPACPAMPCLLAQPVQPALPALHPRTARVPCLRLQITLQVRLALLTCAQHEGCCVACIPKAGIGAVAVAHGQQPPVVLIDVLGYPGAVGALDVALAAAELAACRLTGLRD